MVSRHSRCYLDTHVVIWMAQKSTLKTRLSSTAISVIERRALAISPVVKLELQYLFEVHRIERTADEICTKLYHDIDLQIVPQTSDKLFQTALGLHWTRDLFDRLLVAQAIVDAAPLLSKDRLILANYQRALW